jgi:hypothetical protein
MDTALAFDAGSIELDLKCTNRFGPKVTTVNV